ncbi:MAG TPA: hypothetical protein VNC50_16650 [Planctomycetia bacterium]|nr:hypothetical protein [Planctomycetia bacterium]
MNDERAREEPADDSTGAANDVDAAAWRRFSNSLAAADAAVPSPNTDMILRRVRARIAPAPRKRFAWRTPAAIAAGALAAAVLWQAARLGPNPFPDGRGVHAAVAFAGDAEVDAAHSKIAAEIAHADFAFSTDLDPAPSLGEELARLEEEFSLASL